MERTRGTCKTPPSSPTWGNKGEKTERKGAKKKKNSWRCYDQKLLKWDKFDKIHKSTNPRSLMNCKYDKLKETLQETHYNRTVKRQRDNLEDSRDN